MEVRGRGNLSREVYYTILYYTILYYAILYYSIIQYDIIYYTILCYTIQQDDDLHHIEEAAAEGVVPSDGDVDVDVLVDEAHDALQALAAAHEDLQDAPEDRVGASLLVLRREVPEEPLDRLDDCDDAGAVGEGAHVLEESDEDALLQHGAGHFAVVVLVRLREVVESHRVGDRELVQGVHELQDPEGPEHVEDNHLLLLDNIAYYNIIQYRMI